MPKPTPVDGLDADTPLAEAARRLLAARLGDVRAYEGAVAQALEARAPDADAVHDMRVATRRLRAALRLFGRAGRVPQLLTLGQEVADVGRALGAVRDLDVQAGWLDQQRSAGLPDEERPGIEALAAHRLAGRPGAEEALRAALARFRDDVVPRFEEEVARLTPHARAPNGVRVRGRLGGGRVRRLIVRRLARLDALIDETVDSVDATRAHTLRILAKKLRYDVELVESALPVAGLLAALVPLQELLGELHDRDVRIPLLERRLVVAPPVEWPGLVGLLRADLDERDRLATRLEVELRHAQSERLARRFRRAVRDAR
jgi:CHAD domain-containing protein